MDEKKRFPQVVDYTIYLAVFYAVLVYLGYLYKQIVFAKLNIPISLMEITPHMYALPMILIVLGFILPISVILNRGFFISKLRKGYYLEDKYVFPFFLILITCVTFIVIVSLASFHGYSLKSYDEDYPFALFKTKHIELTDVDNQTGNYLMVTYKDGIYYLLDRKNNDSLETVLIPSDKVKKIKVLS
ncbi:MAG: hypothetical protein ACLFP2_01190 [Candidatus Woesearchaeota archaeon]